MRGALTCLITDSRYAVPTLAFYMCTDPARARELAAEDLRSNPNHHAVEVRDGDAVLFVLTREDVAATA